MASRPDALPVQNISGAATATVVTDLSSRGTVRVWKSQPLLARAARTDERIDSLHFPVEETPRFIFSAESQFREETGIAEDCGNPGPARFLLLGSRLYTFLKLTHNPLLAPALRPGAACSQEPFANFLADEHRSPWAVELLNRFLRYHAWKRGLRFDESQQLFYFTRSKPKRLFWEIAGKLIEREVTAPNLKWNQFPGGEKAEYQCGWKHEAVRAAFVQQDGFLSLRLEPTWFLTELDGKTPSTNQRVRPVSPPESFKHQNKRALEALQFWSGILTKGHRELRIETGANPIRVRLSCAGALSRSAAAVETVPFCGAAPPCAGEPQLIPELIPIQA